MSFDKVLCIVDANVDDRRSARAGVRLAQQLAAELILVDTLQTPFLTMSLGGELGYFPPMTASALAERAADNVEDSLESLADEMSEEHGLTVEAELLRGKPGERVPEFAREHDADLIVMHRDASSLLDRIFGNDSDLAHEAACPVIYCAGPPVTGPIEHAVVGINLSQRSGEVLEAAASIVGPSGKLSLVHAWGEDDELAVGCNDAGLGRELHRRAHEQKTAALRDLGRRCDAMPDIDYYIDVGDPVMVLMRRAEALDADAIFVGAHAPTGVGERLLGTTTDRMIASAVRPIIAIPQTPGLN